MGGLLRDTENLIKRFEDVTAVDDLNLKIARGELFNNSSQTIGWVNR